MARKNILTNHHIIGKSARIGDIRVVGSNHIDNILRLKDTPHRGLHMLFNIDNHPVSQYQQLFNMTSKVLVGDIKEEIRQILDFAEKLGYKAYREELFEFK